MRLDRGGEQYAVVVLVALFGLPVAAAATSDASDSAGLADSEALSWDVRAALSGYFFSERSAYLQATAAVDYGVLHLEVRYNYEAQHTGSLWVGWNFEWGTSLKLSLTPMLGGVLGEVSGIAPGLEGDLSWGPLEF